LLAQAGCPKLPTALGIAANFNPGGGVMANVLIGAGLLLIILIAGAVLLYSLYPAAFPIFRRHAHVPNQGVIKRDWVATGRIDFATSSITNVTSNSGDIDRPTELKLLVEERRIVESLAGNENLEVQWRLASLREAKSVVTRYHQYLSDHSLIKTVTDETPSLLPPGTTQENPSE
jgi:hypothetical protein